MPRSISKRMTLPIILITTLSCAIIFLSGCSQSPSSASGTSSASLQAPSSEVSPAYQAYMEECDKIIKEYGEGEIKSNVGATGSEQFISGLCYAELVDFEADGDDELLLAYGDGESYRMEVLEYGESGCKRQSVDLTSDLSYENGAFEHSSKRVFVTRTMSDSGKTLPLLGVADSNSMTTSWDNGDYSETDRTESLRYYTFSYDYGASEVIRFDETAYVYANNRGPVFGERLPSKLSINGETVARQEYYDKEQLYSANQTSSLLYSNYASGGTSFEIEQMLQEVLDNTQAVLTRLSGK